MADDLLREVERIRPTLEECSAQAERERRLPDAAYDAMLDAGLFRMLAPKAYGGLERHPVPALEVFEALSRIDSSAAWNLNISGATAVFAALAGGLMAYYSGFITPAKASFLHSVELVTMVVFGGMASVFGAIVGATVLTVLPQVLTVLKDYEMVVFGGLLMLTMMFVPRGIVPTLHTLLRRQR